MKKTIFAAAMLLGCTLISCKKTNMAAQEQAGRNPVANILCMGKPIKGVNCLDVYRPVCGCNGVTYSNACYANIAGVKSYTEGTCEGGGGGGTVKQAK
jgi:Kazal-type serine protease inhibitor domain